LYTGIVMSTLLFFIFSFLQITCLGANTVICENKFDMQCDGFPFQVATL